MVVYGSVVLLMLSSLVHADQRQVTQQIAGEPTRGVLRNAIELPAPQMAQCGSAQIADRLRQDCANVSHVFALMSAEPRDKAWAGPTESYLQSWIEGLGSRGFTARNIECRLSWCVVEAESTQGGSLILNLIEARNRKLFQSATLFAPDSSTSDSSIMDILVVFKRYCKSTRELLDNDGKIVLDFDSQGKTC